MSEKIKICEGKRYNFIEEQYENEVYLFGYNKENEIDSIYNILKKIKIKVLGLISEDMKMFEKRNHYSFQNLLHKNIEIIKVENLKNNSGLRFTKGNEYYVAAEPPVRCGESHLSGVARATFPDKQSHLVTNYCIMF